jgi:hypothetical protein
MIRPRSHKWIPYDIVSLRVEPGTKQKNVEGRSICAYKERTNTVKLGYSNIGFCDTLSIASNIMWKCPFRLQRYSFITTLFLGPFDDVITEFYCI